MTSQNLTSLQHQFSGWEQAQEYYVEANLTDGLPFTRAAMDIANEIFMGNNA
jgi:hypothetical protein